MPGDAAANVPLAAPGAPAARAPAAGPFVLVLFTVTMFVSALLLFTVQPMVGKMLLPSLGGTPAVWNTCMVFFQAVLLAGYAYSHLTTTWLGLRKQAVLHVLVLLLPLLTLPITVLSGSTPPTEHNPIPWLLGRMAVAVGLPFFVVTTGAPLLQRWFAHTGHPTASDPYFLYAASNAGSLIALLGYPVLLERMWTVGQQSLAWSAGYIVLILLIAACAVALWRGLRVPYADTASAAREDSASPALRRRLYWVLLAFLPSSLMLGVTAHITTDVATVPLLWVVPLALYLLTFVLVFARRQLIPPAVPAWALPILLVLTVFVGGQDWAGGAAGRSVQIVLHLLVFFCAALVCHARLAQDRPGVRHLTVYYLLMSVGGVLGGLFNAIVAPTVFPAVIEYPLVLVVTCLMLPADPVPPQQLRLARWLDLLLPLAAALLLGLLSLAKGAPRSLVYGFPALLALACLRRPLRLALCLAALLLVPAYFDNFRKNRLLHIERNFFGVKRVMQDPAGACHMLVHGGTLHGLQATDPRAQREPFSYYHRAGPAGDVFRVLAQAHPGTPVAAVGLGAGSIATYMSAGQPLTFFEIDPGVARIALDERYFTFLAQCRGPVDIVLGDGRLTLAAAPAERYGLIFLDAFNSDAVPTHLLTREALELYLSRLAPRGWLAFHATNATLDLPALLAVQAANLQLVAFHRHDPVGGGGKDASDYVVMARTAADLRSLVYDSNWKRLSPRSDVAPWTDQYSSLLALLKR